MESDQQNNNGWLFNANASYITESSRFNGYIGRSLLPSAYGNIAEADTARLNYSRDLSERWSLGLNARFYSTDNSSDNDNGVERKLATITPSIDWEMTESFTLGLGYTYDWIDRNDEPDSYTGNSVSVTFRYTPPSQL